MNKQFIVRKNEEIELIVKRGRKKVSKYFILYYTDSEKIYNQYCVSVSKKLGKAHIRNKIKRRIKDILMKNKMEFNKKYVIIIRKEALLVSYKEKTGCLEMPFIPWYKVLYNNEWFKKGFSVIHE